MPLARFVYPIAFLGFVAVLWLSLAGGVAYPAVGPPLLIASGCLVVWLEHRYPHAVAWQRDVGDLRTDIVHLIANVATSQVAIVLYSLVLHASAGGTGLWPGDWPLGVQLLVGTVVVDLGLYWVHRTSHVVRWLWDLHAVHHAPRRVYWINSQRRHLLHEVLEGAPGLLVLGVLGAPPLVVAGAFFAITVHLMWQHGNIAYRAGVLRYVFGVAEIHRWHHQRKYADVQGNYAAIFALWDLLFGTRLPQAGQAPLDVGMDYAPDMPADWWGQHRWSIRRWLTRSRG